KGQQEIAGLERNRLAASQLVVRLETDLGTIDDQLTPLNEAEQHIKFLEQRQTSLTPEKVLTQERLDSARQSVTTLEGRLQQTTADYQKEDKQLTELSDGIARYRSTLPAGPERDQLDRQMNEIAARKDEMKNDLFGLKQQHSFAQNNVKYWEGRNDRFLGGAS